MRSIYCQPILFLSFFLSCSLSSSLSCSSSARPTLMLSRGALFSRNSDGGQRFPESAAAGNSWEWMAAGNSWKRCPATNIVCMDQVGRRRLRGASCNWSHSCPSLSSGGGGGGGGIGVGGGGGGAFSNNNESDWLNSTLGDWDSPTPPILATQYWGKHLCFLCLLHHLSRIQGIPHPLFPSQKNPLNMNTSAYIEHGVWGEVGGGRGTESSKIPN